MLLATILLLCPLPQADVAVKAVTERPAGVTVEATKVTTSANALPSTPDPKIKTDVEVAEASSPAPLNAAAPIAPANPPLALRPVRPATREEYGTERQKKIWLALTVASSGAAAFDAWSTRRAISGGYGTESNPLLRPFAHSNAIYVATQVSPLVLDFVGRKMMTSRHSWMRKMWWLPQSAGAGMSLSAGVHNVGVVP
ncbi:MAG TPA: hypothetical protein VMI32_16250 [Candidatus Solibacter sp.]|nr:hypothetical protein [Candidatus Solibacter sp.]